MSSKRQRIGNGAYGLDLAAHLASAAGGSPMHVVHRVAKAAKSAFCQTESGNSVKEQKDLIRHAHAVGE